MSRVATWIAPPTSASSWESQGRAIGLDVSKTLAMVALFAVGSSRMGACVRLVTCLSLNCLYYRSLRNPATQTTLTRLFAYTLPKHVSAVALRKKKLQISIESEFITVITKALCRRANFSEVADGSTPEQQVRVSGLNIAKGKKKKKALPAGVE